MDLCSTADISFLPFPPSLSFRCNEGGEEGVDAYEREKKSHPRSVQSIPLLGGCPLDTTNRYSRFDMDLGGVQPPAKLSSRPRFSLSLSQIRFQGGAN